MGMPGPANPPPVDRSFSEGKVREDDRRLAEMEWRNLSRLPEVPKQ